jgi:tetratricopeptide (TPR) repeat protein
MLAASPITRQTVGRTFVVAGSLLGAIAVAQIAVFLWVYARQLHVPSRAIAGAETVARATPEDANFAADPLKTGETPESPAETAGIAALTAVRPVPLPPRPPTLAEPEQSARFKETIDMGKLLRDRGDMSTALTRFREAAAMDPKSPEAIYEIAVTFEKMQLPDKAAEQWRRMYEMGEGAGPYYTAAEARLSQARQSTMQAAEPELAAQGAEVEEGIAPGKSLGLLPVTAADEEDRGSSKRLALRIPIKARAREKVNVRDLTIQVLFYDIVDNQNLVQTTANVSSRWTTAPADWSDSNTETLEVDYQLPLPDAKAARRENRKYFGYLIRVYYKGELQAATGAPDRLVQQFPPEPKLSEDSSKK